MTGGVHRAAAGTKVARQVAVQTSLRGIRPFAWRSLRPTEIELWNAAVNAKKAARKAAKEKK